MALIRKIRAVDSRMRILVLTCLEDFAYAQQAIEYGVSNYILKPVSYTHLFHVGKHFTRKVGEEDVQHAAYVADGNEAIIFHSKTQ